MSVELAPGTPDRPGVRSLVEALRAAPGGLQWSVGRVCGGRVAAVALGPSLALRSVVLEPHELDDPAAGQARALELAARPTGEAP